MPLVNSAVLVWARKTAGLTPADAAQRLGLRDSSRGSAVAKLARLEIAGARVSRSMLLRMSKVYRRPLLTFYLSYVPEKGARGQDFRTLPADYTVTDNALVDTLVREIRARQSIVREVMEAEDEAQPCGFIGEIKLSDGIPAAVRLLREILNMSPSEYRDAPSSGDAFKRLRKCAEGAGIFVLLQGDLGSYQSQISVETFRGFALADKVAPFVVINDQDSSTAWSFTLLHEIVHLCLGVTGISGGRLESALEQFCNEAASAYLVDDDELNVLRIDRSLPQEDARRRITDFALARHLSSTMVSYRLFRKGAISLEEWNDLRRFFRAMWLHTRASQREKARHHDGGPSYYTVRRHRVGDALIGFARRMMADGALSTTKAARVLAVKPQGVGPLLAV